MKAVEDENGVADAIEAAENEPELFGGAGVAVE